LAGLFVAGVVAGPDAQASAKLKILRVNCCVQAFAFPPNDGAFHQVCCVSVSNKLAGGLTHVSASGMSVMAGGDYLTLTLDRNPDSRGPWVFSYGPTGTYYNWSVENCFGGSNVGPNSFYLNVADFGPGGGSDVELCALFAAAYQNPLTEDCSLTGYQFGSGSGVGASNR
jgi:hypothetical protein